MFNLNSRFDSRWLLASLALLSWATASHATSAREEGRLLTATQVLEEVQGMPDQRLPDLLLSRAYGIAIIPDVTKVAFAVGGRRGHGVLVVRDKLTSPWSNPTFVALTGGSFGWQIGAQASDVILVFTTKTGVEGIAGGKITLGADASVAAGPVGRTGSAATDTNFDAEIYSYSRSRGLFAGVSLDGSALTIDKKSNAAFYGKSGVTATDIFSGQGPANPPAGQRFLERLSQATRTADRPAASAPPPVAPAAPAPAPTKTFPMEDQKPGAEPPK